VAIVQRVRLLIGDSATDLGNVTVCVDTLPDPDETRIRLGAVDTNVGEQVATLLEHAARQLRKGTDDAVAPAR
jgi:hypothetical protein